MYRGSSICFWGFVVWRGINKGLIGHYVLDGENYNPTTSKVTDKTPYSRHGTNLGATLTTGRNGKLNGAMSFNPASYNKISTSTNYNNYEEFSISAWIYPISYDDSQFRIIFGDAIGNILMLA
jgi:hypothetical protein